MLKYMVVLLTSFMGIIFGVGVFNLNYDTAGVYKDMEIEDFVAMQMIQGNDVYVDLHIDHYKLYRAYIDLSESPPESIVIGSSQVASMSREEVGRETFMNHWINSANIEDFYVILGMYEERLTLPEEIILAIDPSIFNHNREESRWYDAAEDFNYMLGIISGSQDKVGSDNIFKKAKAIFSLHYAIENYKNMNNNNIDYLQPEDLAVAENLSRPDDGYILKSDGSVEFRFDYDGMSLNDREKMIRKHLSIGIYSCENFDAIDELARKRFQDLIEFLMSRDLKVVILLPPYHPMVYERIAADAYYSNILEVEDMLRNIKGVVVVGSYDPSIDGYNEEDFFDGIHIESLSKSLNDLD